MFKLDNDFLTSLGLGSLPVDEKNKLLQHIYERLEMNVGMRLAEKMSDQQLDEFEGFIDRNDEAGALRWLESNFPNYKEVVAQELEKLKNEVSMAAPQILAAAQNAPVTPQAPASPTAGQTSQQGIPPTMNPYQQAPGQQAPFPPPQAVPMDPGFNAPMPSKAPAQQQPFAPSIPNPMPSPSIQPAYPQDQPLQQPFQPPMPPVQDPFQPSSAQPSPFPPSPASSPAQDQNFGSQPLQPWPPVDQPSQQPPAMPQQPNSDAPKPPEEQKPEGQAPQSPPQPPAGFPPAY